MFCDRKEFPFSIDKKYLKKAEKGDLTKDDLLNLSYTDVLRLATFEPASELIEKELKMKGVPLSEEFQIYDHQIETLRWMRMRESKEHYGVLGGIVCLKMGLGKTLLSLLHILSTPREAPSLVVLPKSVLYEWKSQIEKFFGDLEIRVMYIHKDLMPKKAIDAITVRSLKKYDVVITTYDVCLRACKIGGHEKDCLEIGDEHSMMKGKVVAVHLRSRKDCLATKGVGIHALYSIEWERVISDESSKFANPDTKVYRAMMALCGKYKWCLSGTPITNYTTDIWAQLRYCGYLGCETQKRWGKGAPFFKHTLKDCMIVMDYASAEIILPPKTKYQIDVSLEGHHLEFYNWMLRKTKEIYKQMTQKVCTFASVLAMFTRLRQCAIAPYLVTGGSKRGKKKNTSDVVFMSSIEQDFVGTPIYEWLTDINSESGINSVKITKILDIIAKIPKGDKILVFSTFTSCLDLLANAIDEKIAGFRYVQIDGDSSAQERADLLERFKTKSKVRAILATYKTCAMGLNITEATHCICIEPWWNNAVHYQAEARCWRNGQTREVTVYQVLVDNTIEERVVGICNDKDDMIDNFMEGSKTSIKNVGLDKYTLGKILGIYS